MAAVSLKNYWDRGLEWAARPPSPEQLQGLLLAAQPNNMVGAHTLSLLLSHSLWSLWLLTLTSIYKKPNLHDPHGKVNAASLAVISIQGLWPPASTQLWPGGFKRLAVWDWGGGQFIPPLTPDGQSTPSWRLPPGALALPEETARERPPSTAQATQTRLPRR